jgi:primase-polymerase (primpol)-like protein
MFIETHNNQRPINPKRIAQELRSLRQWGLWLEEHRNNQPAKVPWSVNGHRASPTNLAHWTSFDLAFEAYRQGGWNGLAFVFSPEDELCGLDLDDVYLSDAAEDPEEWARPIIQRFSDTYGEESPGSLGIKFWFRARALRCGRYAIKNGSIEVYDRARFFCVTGRSNGVLTIADHQTDLDLLITKLDCLSGRAGVAAHAGEQRPAAAAIGQKISTGKRHNSLLSLAGTLWRRGLDPEEIEVTLLTVNSRRCDPPYSPRHIHKLVGSIQGWAR